MTRFFYTKLAVSNIRKNSRTYLPYIAAATCIVAMFYMAHFLAVDKAVADVAESETVQIILWLGIWIDGIFSAIFLFYTNSFLIKRRKKEFGLFNILGMEKKHIGRVLALETLLTAAGSILMGILLGISFSKLLLMLLFRLLNYPVPLGFSVSVSSLLCTLGLFAAIFVGILLWNLRSIRLANPIELLQGGDVGEREPKTRWFTAAVGLITVGIGYFIALTTKSPLQAIFLFFAAVILVMIGTYCLFSAGSILLLKLLRRNKAYYYQPSHFYSISGMLYRMKQNAVGLANICILSTGVMVMLSTTLSLYMGGDDVMRTRYPHDITVSIYHEAPIETAPIVDTVEAELSASGISHGTLSSVMMAQMNAVYSAGSFNTAENPDFMDNGYVVQVIDRAEYTRLTGKTPTLQKGELLYYNGLDSTEYPALNIYGQEFAVRERLEVSPIGPLRDLGMMNSCVIVTDSMETNLALMKSAEQDSTRRNTELYYQVAFDTPESVDAETEKLFVTALGEKLSDLGSKHNFSHYIDSIERARKNFFALYGGLLFLGIFLGTIFILATVLIIYYKQVSEGYDDRERFQIMQKVGMDGREVMSTIRSQVLTVFILPIAVAIVHLAVAFPVLTKLLAVLNLYNVPLFAAWTVITVLVFGVFYGAVYAITAKIYYRIVR